MIQLEWPRGLMDKVSDFESEDCEFESRRGLPAVLNKKIRIVSGPKQTIGNFIHYSHIYESKQISLCFQHQTVRNIE